LRRRIHGGLPQILAPPQAFRIDRANLVEGGAQLAKIVDQSGNLQMSVVNNGRPSISSSARDLGYAVNLTPLPTAA